MCSVYIIHVHASSLPFVIVVYSYNVEHVVIFLLFLFISALVTRCLQAIILLVPDMKDHFHKRLSVKQRVLLDQFDVVTSDLSSHCREINSKVMGIMDDMISKNLSMVRKLDR